MARTLVCGDIHGAARALEQVLERAGFEEGDRLISLGDVCDGWPEVDRCIDRLLEIPDLILVLGNHDEWALGWMRREESLAGWYGQGGRGTVESYARRAGQESPRSERAAASLARTVPAEHRRLLESARPYHIETRPDGRRLLFTHAGWTRGNSPERQDAYDLRWGRDLWTHARVAEGIEDSPPVLPEFDEAYLGHTPTPWREPKAQASIWNLDQGAGWTGVLTLMDVDSHVFWQSDPVGRLYPDAVGRAG